MKGTTNCRIFDIEKLQTVKISIVTNQDDHSDLIGSTINVSYLDDTTQYVWDGNDITLSIPVDVTYTISFPDIQGYLTPETQIYTATEDIKNVTAIYKCELLTVNVTSDTGDIINNFTIIISDIGELTLSSGVFKVPFGVTYTVSASNVDGFITPDNQTFEANQTNRIVTMTYIMIVNGVYVYDTDGKLTSPSLWNTANNSKAVGVAIISDNCRFVVAKEDIGYSIRWGGYGTDISTLTSYTDAAAAATDFDGVNNTAKIIAAIGNSNDGYRDGSAAGDCAAYTFPNGKTGYLGAGGEWRTAFMNQEALDSALELIGGTTMLDGYYWTSTEYSSNHSWRHLFDSANYLGGANKYSINCIRAFLAI